ncbi:MurR/RpiR family transcriptional regulator [Leptotrichia sp. HSP-342]|uniref:MurR/RpiR family transcriptional regulator n=1 Tax=Leptotrichia mesophila TaxID=3239303 RepID=A0AB39VEK2_9FUSO
MNNKRLELNKNYESKIREVYGELRKSEQKVADYVLQNKEKISIMGLEEVAKQSDVSTPTVIRFTKALGYDGFKEFKIELLKSLPQNDEIKNDKILLDLHVNKNDKLEDLPIKIIGLSIKALEDTLKFLNYKDYRKAIELITNSNIIDIYGVGNSGSIGNDFMNKLTRVGINCRTYSDNHLQQLCACHLTENDLAIAISHSGGTKDTIDALHIAKESGAKTLVLTNFKASKITKYADITLFTGDTEKTFYSETMSSRISQLALVDMLYMGILLSDYDKYTKRLNKVNNLSKFRTY